MSLCNVKVGVGLLGGLLLASTVGWAQGPYYGRVVVRDSSDEYHTRSPDLWLVPIRLLEKPLAQWTQEEKDLVPRKYLDEFNARIERVRAEGLSGICDPGEGVTSRHRDTANSPDFRTNFSQVVGREKSVILGEVVAAEPALDVLSHQMATLVHLKVSQVVRNRDSIAVGDIISFRRTWGSATVRGVTLCSHPGVYSGAAEGDLEPPVEQSQQTLLLIGGIAPGNRTFFDSSRFQQFQIIDGYLHYPQDVVYYHGNKPEKLDLALATIQEPSP